MADPFRVAPALGPELMKTYAIVRRDGIHHRPATCAEVECPQWANGWVTRVTRGSDLEKFLVGQTHGRRFTETTGLGEAEREFMFKPGQPCFRASRHRIAIEREPFFVVRDGDWRGNPHGTPAVNRKPADWVDDFANHQQHIADVRDRG